MTNKNARPHELKTSALDGSDFRTVTARVLDALQRGEALTSADAWRRFSASRLAAAIHKLRRQGHRIKTVLIDVETADQGRRAHVAKYFLRERG